jgi:hypothetical protein
MMAGNPVLCKTLRESTKTIPVLFIDIRWLPKEAFLVAGTHEHLGLLQQPKVHLAGINRYNPNLI